MQTSFKQEQFLIEIYHILLVGLLAIEELAARGAVD